MPDHPPSMDERASLAEPSQSSSPLECTSHLGFSLGEPVGDVFELRLGSEVLGDGYVVGVVRIAVQGIKADEVVCKLPSFMHGEVPVKNQEYKEVERPAIEIVDHSSLGGSLGIPGVLDLIGLSSGGVYGVEADVLIWGKFEPEAFANQQFGIACDGIASRGVEVALAYVVDDPAVGKEKFGVGHGVEVHGCVLQEVWMGLEVWPEIYWPVDEPAVQHVFRPVAYLPSCSSYQGRITQRPRYVSIEKRRRIWRRPHP